ncbi:TspO/MBR family protein [Corynebacterium sp.]|uniref:TspO/MBR family protein n=1 Tax=Corynebacterium sp. TaxID=1720 RepID=UPI0026DC6BF3|nr:TspO/MBR family protein [Corynebacterium sp.]MDO5076104.1 TspO/MBR family protein [Corynebacterium sp.]
MILAADPKARLREERALKWLSVVALVVTLAVNTIANTLRIGGFTTGEVAQRYSNYFTPVGFTFSIWSVIYALLAIYVVYQFSPIRARFHSLVERQAFARISVLFIGSCLLNIGWIFAWHYRAIDASLLLIIALFVVLSMIVRKVHQATYEKRSIADYVCAVLPFMVYFGWITVAVVANFYVWLVSIGWHPLFENQTFWLGAALFMGLSMGFWNSVYLRDTAYALVLVWATLGILIRHVFGEGGAAARPGVVVLVAVMLLLAVINAVGVGVLQRRHRA